MAGQARAFCSPSGKVRESSKKSNNINILRYYTAEGLPGEKHHEFVSMKKAAEAAFRNCVAASRVSAAGRCPRQRQYEDW
jgi:hypothetical protein